ncbi:MAG: SDR family oxidoreductase [Phycisphaerales bacterium]|nr:SDR family oxidoreductase [Phycisphaerales bacterium]
MLHNGSNVFTTGATGLIGGELVRTLITQPIGKVWALVRPTDDSPAERLSQRLRRSGPSAAVPAQRFPVAVAGDVTQERLGMSPEDYEDVRRNVDIIIHSAAETSFLRASACRSTNIAGAKNLIEFTRQCTRRPLLVCLSTAFVSGVVANACLSEDEGCRPKDDHHNEYTHSKAVAEELVRSSGLPVLVVRPSVVLSAGVPDEQFARAILQFCPLLKELGALPVDPQARPDVVPVQFVVDSTIRLLQTPHRRYDLYHISCGLDGAMTYEELRPAFERFYHMTSPMRLVAPRHWNKDLHRTYIRTPDQRRIFATIKNYLPFLNMNVLFDNTRLKQELGDRFPPLPRLDEYLFGLLEMVSHDRIARRWLAAKGA